MPNIVVDLKAYESLLQGQVSKFTLGLVGEALVAKYVESLGCELKAHRKKIQNYCEIDLIFEKDNFETWIEVKTTQDQSFHFFPWTQRQQNALNLVLEKQQYKNPKKKYQVSLALVSAKKIQFIDQSYLMDI